jgi:hypothetical protein
MKQNYSMNSYKPETQTANTQLNAVKLRHIRS